MSTDNESYTHRSVWTWLRHICAVIVITIILAFGVAWYAYTQVHTDRIERVLTSDERARVWAIEPAYQTALLLWSQVYSDGRLWRITQQRADTAVSLLKDGTVESILISGDWGSVYYDEVTAINNYLQNQWVDRSQIFQDFAWFDTYDSLYRAQEIFEVERALIVTQWFHLPRALYIAKKLWIEAQGVPADSTRPINSDALNFREYFAATKARRNVLVRSDPKFWWERIPITGESNW